ncbi:MAG: ABC transporter ATP-binding protein [Oscillospiraceae bacterium]|nr:ABC transporter ATP-binding protein [Oscillospiraceae bacterium]
MALLDIRNLSISFFTDEGVVEAVSGIDLSVERGETVGLVGETGAGKTTAALGILQLIPSPPGKILNGEIIFDGKDLVNASESEMRKVRGNRISMIFQDPMTALNPVIRVDEQIAEVIRLHSKCTMKSAMQQAIDMLVRVGIRADRCRDFPHQFSGGMKQRVVIAMSLACNPELLIADEPTTALDVTIQAQVLDMMNDLKKDLGSSMILITHDLGVVADCCDKVAIMYAGQIVEFGTLEEIFLHTAHPYTQGLFDSLPSLDKDVKRLKQIPGLMPDPTNLPDGCRFAPRCAYHQEKCSLSDPGCLQLSSTHYVKCCMPLKDVCGRREDNG